MASSLLYPGKFTFPGGSMFFVYLILTVLLLNEIVVFIQYLNRKPNPTHFSSNQEYLEAVKDLLAQNKRIEAIKLHRILFQTNLREAVEAIDTLLAIQDKTKSNHVE
jgi:ribosomal protein L7/L12